MVQQLLKNNIRFKNSAVILTYFTVNSANSVVENFYQNTSVYLLKNHKCWSRSKKPLLCNMETTNFSIDYTSGECLSQGRIQTEYTALFEPSYNSKNLTDSYSCPAANACLFIPVMLPKHVGSIFPVLLGQLSILIHAVDMVVLLLISFSSFWLQCQLWVFYRYQIHVTSLACFQNSYIFCSQW